MSVLHQQGPPTPGSTCALCEEVYTDFPRGRFECRPSNHRSSAQHKDAKLLLPWVRKGYTLCRQGYGAIHRALGTKLSVCVTDGKPGEDLLVYAPWTTQVYAPMWISLISITRLSLMVRVRLMEHGQSNPEFQAEVVGYYLLTGFQGMYDLLVETYRRMHP